MTFNLVQASQASVIQNILLDIINKIGVTNVCMEENNGEMFYDPLLSCNELKLIDRSKYVILHSHLEGLINSTEKRHITDSQPIWDVVSTKVHPDVVKLRLEDVQANFSVSPILILSEVNSKVFTLHKLCPEFGQNPTIGLTQNILSWSENGTLLKITNQPFFCPGYAKGASFHVSIIGLPPFLVQRGPHKFSGTDIETLNILGEKMGFSITCGRQRSWGNEVGDAGKWSGVIGMVMEGKSQVGTSHIALLLHRYKVIDYILLYPLPASYLTPKPVALSPLWNSFRPFSINVWLAILGSILLALWIVGILSRQRKYDDIFIIIQSQGKQGLFKWWKYSLPVRCFLGFWFLYVFFIVCAYECDLVAHLTKEDFELPINDEKDIIAQGRQLYLPRSTIFIYLFRESPNALQRAMYQEMKEKNHFMEFVRGYATLEFEKRMIKENLVMITNRLMRMASYDETVRRHGYEPFRLSPPIALPDMPSGIVVPKNALYYQEFIRITEYLKAGGFIEKFTWDHISGKRAASLKREHTLKSISMEHCFGGLCIIISGIVLSLFCFLVEAKTQ